MAKELKTMIDEDGIKVYKKKFCDCGCNEHIIWRKSHGKNAIPIYKAGHSPAQRENTRIQYEKMPKLNFSGMGNTMEEVFGETDINYFELTKILTAYINSNNIRKTKSVKEETSEGVVEEVIKDASAELPIIETVGTADIAQVTGYADDEEEEEDE